MRPARSLRVLRDHQAELRACTRCGDMHKPVVVGPPVSSRVLLVGQAPGPREPQLGRPFGWTAGKQLFKWFEPLGLNEQQFRERVYIAAVCRCFPGKQGKGGDRVPNPAEIANCRPWLDREIELLRPQLIVPVGRLAIAQFLPTRPLVEIIGSVHRVNVARREIDVVPLPHPSGLSSWPKIEPGKSLTAAALHRIGDHPAWRALTAKQLELSRGQSR